MKTHTSSFKEQIKLMGKEIDSRITFGDTVLGKDDLNAVTPSYQGAILKSVMKQLDIDSNVEIPIGTILTYEFGLKVNGEYEYINYGNYVVYSIEKQEDTNSYKITCYDKLLYSMLDYVKLPITYPISIRDYINAISTALGLKFANKNGTFANYNKQIQADLYDGLGYTFRDILDELAQVTASTICLNNNDELEIRYITETGDTIDEEFLKDVNVNFGEKFGAVNTIVLSRSSNSDSVYYPSVLPANPYEIKISDNQIMNGNDRADFLPDIYNKLNGLEFYTNDFVSTGICYYDLCDRYSVKVGDNTYSCVMFNDEVLVTQGLEENIYTELPEQTETDYKRASKDDRMINQVYIIAKKNEAEILALVSTTESIQKEINPTKDESGSEIIIDDASNNPLTYLEVEGKSTQEVRNWKNLVKLPIQSDIDVIGIKRSLNLSSIQLNGTTTAGGEILGYVLGTFKAGTYTYSHLMNNNFSFPNTSGSAFAIYIRETGTNNTFVSVTTDNTNYNLLYNQTFTLEKDSELYLQFFINGEAIGTRFNGYNINLQIEEGSIATDWQQYGVSPSPDYPSEIESVGYENLANYNIKQSASNIVQSDVFSVLPNNTYTFSTTTRNTQVINYYKDIDKKDISNSGWRNTPYTFTTPENCYYIQQLIRKEDNSSIKPSDLGDLNLFKSSIAHSYIPLGKYGIEVKTTNGTDTNITVLQLNEPLRSLPNGVKDIAYIKNNKLYVDRYVGSVVLDGSEEWIYDAGYFRLTVPNIKRIYIDIRPNILSSHFTPVTNAEAGGTNEIVQWIGDSSFIGFKMGENASVDDWKTWLSTNNVQVDYELATPVTEELGEIEMLKTLKGYNNISTTNKLLPIINLTYVRDTVIADYVENHVTELKLTENEIKASVESVSSSVDGLNTTINRVEEITNDNSQIINVISTNIDKTTGEIREVTTTNGFKFDSKGLNIYTDENSYNTQIDNIGTYYKDGNEIVSETTKDGSTLKNLKQQGQTQYSYDGDSYDFIEERVEADGEYCYATFYNGED